jgi:periplasmic protein TonB
MSDFMNNISVYDELDQAIDQMLAAPEDTLPSHDFNAAEVGELVELAAELRYLPGANFKARLKLELEWEAADRMISSATETNNTSRPSDLATAAPANQILPSLFGKTWAGYPVQRINFALSAALHGVMVLLIGAGFLMVKSYAPHVDFNPSVTVRLEPYPFPIGYQPSTGGGSGGAAQKTPASKGVAPRAAREQLTPPVLLRNNIAPLVAEATVIAPPDIELSRTKQVGDPLSKIADFSNGPGVRGGIGGRIGTGAGEGDGPGRGPGSKGGCCGDVFGIGNGVSMPKPIYSPEPEFSEEARKVKHQGDVVLLATIGADGHPHDLTVVRSLGMGLDEKALEAVRTWRFDPAKKDGRPVAVKMNIIVNFRLF